MNITYVAVYTLFLLQCMLLLYRLWMAADSAWKRTQVGTCKTIGSRELQMDYFAVEENDKGMLAVLSDGMGKEAGGKVASETVIKTFQELFCAYNVLDHPSYFFQKAFLTANREILKLTDGKKGYATAGAIMIREHFLYYAIVGNVKAAVFRDRELVPLGRGHTVNVLAEERFYRGGLKREDALAMLHEKRTYNFLGRDGFRQIEFFDEPIRLKTKDIVVLMSDGIYEEIKWKQIEDYLVQKKSCQRIALEMIEHINHKKGEKDNASIVLIRVGEQT